MDQRWLTSEPIQRKQSWTPQARYTLIAPWAPPIGTGEGDSGYGNLDSEGYGDPSFVDPEEERRRLRERMLSESPFPEPSPEPAWSPPAQAPEAGDSAAPPLAPGNPETQGPVQRDRGWAGGVSDWAQGLSQGLSGALNPQGIAQQATEASQALPEWWDQSPIKRAGEEAARTFQKEGGEVAEEFSRPFVDPSTPVDETYFYGPAFKALGVIPKTAGAAVNVFSGKPLTSPEGKPMGAGDIVEPFVDPLPGAGALVGGMAAASRVGRNLPDLATHANPAIRAVHQMFNEPDPTNVPRGFMDQVEDARSRLVQQFTDSGIHLAKAQQMARDILNNGQLPDNLRPADLQRMMPDPVAEQKIDEGLKPIGREMQGPLYGYLQEVLNFHDNQDKAREIGLRARDEVLNNRPGFEGSMELQVDLRRARIAIDTLEGRLADANNLVHNPPAGVSVAQQLRNQEAADRLGLELNKAQDYHNALNEKLQMAQVAHEQAIRHDAAQAMYDAEMGRTFPGGVNVTDSDTSLLDLEQTVNNVDPQAWGVLQNAAQRTWAYADGLRQTLVDAGVWTQQRADYYREHFPHYIPTNILEHLDAGPSPYPKGKGLSVTDDLVDRMSIEGTDKAREDPLAALARATYATERTAARNRTFNAFIGVRNAAPQLKAMIPEVLPADQDDLRRAADKAKADLLAADPAATEDMLNAAAKQARGYLLANSRVGKTLLARHDYKALQGFENGVKKTYAMPAGMAEAIQGSSYGASGPVSAALNRLARLFTMAATTRFPAFLVGNAVLDAGAYTIKESTRAGPWGPLAAPQALADLAKAYYDLVKSGSGISRNEFTGQAAEILKQGGGQFGMYSGNRAARRETTRSLQRDKFWEIKSGEDLRRFMGDFATLKWVEAAGGRIEMAPRLAAYRRAQRRGLNRLDSTLAARDVTIDFGRGGEFAKLLNQWVPFFNVGIQGAVTPFRAFKANPVGTAATAMGLIGVPTVMTERWNRGWNIDGTFDHQRAKDYANVPDYAKQQGMIFMLPNNAPINSEGTRKPEYLYMRLREWAWAAILARQVVDTLNGGGRPWQSVARDIVQQGAPISSPSDFIPGILGVPTQLMSDSDWFSGRQIATQQNDDEASNLGRLGAQALTGISKHISGDPFAKVRPSQVDFAIRGIGAGLGTTAMGASNMINPPADPRAAGITSTPVLGGVANRFVGNRTGQRVFDVTNNPLPVDMLRTLAEAGVDTKPAAPLDTFTVPGMSGAQTDLKPEQREEYNRLFQVIFNELYAKLPPGGEKDKASLDAILSAARGEATKVFHHTLTPDQIKAQTEIKLEGGDPEQKKLAIDLAADLTDSRRFPEYRNLKDGKPLGTPNEWGEWNQWIETGMRNGQPLPPEHRAALRNMRQLAKSVTNQQLFNVVRDPTTGDVKSVDPKDPRYEAWNRYFGVYTGIPENFYNSYRDGRIARYVTPQGAQLSPAASDTADRWLRMYRDAPTGSKIKADLRPMALAFLKARTPDWKNHLIGIDQADIMDDTGVSDLREQEFAGAGG